MNPWVSLEELRGACNLDLFTAAATDRELLLYLAAFQGFADKYCMRQFDGSLSKTEYQDIDEPTDRLVLQNVPVLSIASIYNDPDRNFDASTLVSSSDYIIKSEIGLVQLKNTNFLAGFGGWGVGETSLKITYTAGYIGEKTIVAAATPANTMTIVNISSYGLPFSLAVQTTGTAVAANITIIGLDQNGTAQTETISIPTTAGRFTSLNKWTSITTFSALGILGTGNTVKLVGNAFPEDLRVAAQLHVAHLYQQDNDKTLNLSSRSVGQKSESGFTKGVPKEVLQILDGYRRYS